MELLSWMKKIDADLSKDDLMEIINEMHGVINTLLVENKKNQETIKELRESLEKK